MGGNRTVLFLSALFLIAGVWLVGFNDAKSNTERFDGKDHSITIIDLSAKDEQSNAKLWIGVGLIAVSIGLLYLYFRTSTQSAKLTSSPSVELTPRESSIAQLMQGGKNAKEIASELSISVSTVKSHINSIYKKNGVNSRADFLKASKNREV